MELPHIRQVHKQKSNTRILRAVAFRGGRFELFGAEVGYVSK